MRRPSSAIRSRATPLDVGSGHGLDGGERLVEREHPVVEGLLAADPRGEVARLVHPQLHAAGEVALRPAQLVVGDDLVTQSNELVEDRPDRLVETGGIDPGRDLEGAGIGVVDEPGADVVGQTAFLAHATGTGGCSSRRRGRR